MQLLVLPLASGEAWSKVLSLPCLCYSLRTHQGSVVEGNGGRKHLGQHLIAVIIIHIQPCMFLKTYMESFLQY